MDALAVEERRLYNSGLYRDKETKPSIFFYTRCAFTVSYSLLFQILMITRMILDCNDLLKVIEASYYLITQTIFLCKLLSFELQRGKYEEIRRIVRSPLFNDCGTHQRASVSKNFKGFKIFRRFFLMCLASVVVIYFAFPIMDGQDMPVPAWFPFDVKRYKYYVILYETIGFSLTAYVNATFDFLYGCLVIIICDQCDILEENLRFACDFSTKGLPKMVRERTIEFRLKKCVIHHLLIIK